MTNNKWYNIFSLHVKIKSNKNREVEFIAAYLSKHPAWTPFSPLPLQKKSLSPLSKICWNPFSPPLAKGVGAWVGVETKKPRACNSITILTSSSYNVYDSPLTPHTLTKTKQNVYITIVNLGNFSKWKWTSGWTNVHDFYFVFLLLEYKLLN